MILLFAATVSKHPFCLRYEIFALQQAVLHELFNRIRICLLFEVKDLEPMLQPLYFHIVPQVADFRPALLNIIVKSEKAPRIKKQKHEDCGQDGDDNNDVAEGHTASPAPAPGRLGDWNRSHDLAGQPHREESVDDLACFKLAKLADIDDILNGPVTVKEAVDDLLLRAEF